jgi:hypothetical protein
MKYLLITVVFVMVFTSKLMSEMATSLYFIKMRKGKFIRSKNKSSLQPAVSIFESLIAIYSINII